MAFDNDPVGSGFIDEKRTGVLIIQPLFVSMGEGQRLANLAAKNRVLRVSDLGMFANAGGLMSYGPDIRDIYHRCAIYVDKILKGAKPADFPVEQPKVRANHQFENREATRFNYSKRRAGKNRPVIK